MDFYVSHLLVHWQVALSSQLLPLAVVFSGLHLDPKIVSRVYQLELECFKLEAFTSSTTSTGSYEYVHLTRNISSSTSTSIRTTTMPG